eukprot:COSAG06_NODE_1890_length_8134_cov_3.128438_3_plen_167_part_00
MATTARRRPLSDGLPSVHAPVRAVQTTASHSGNPLPLLLLLRLHPRRVSPEPLKGPERLVGWRWLDCPSHHPAASAAATVAAVAEGQTPVAHRRQRTHAHPCASRGVVLSRTQRACAAHASVNTENVRTEEAGRRCAEDAPPTPADDGRRKPFRWRILGVGDPPYA